VFMRVAATCMGFQSESSRRTTWSVVKGSRPVRRDAPAASPVA